LIPGKVNNRWLGVVAAVVVVLSSISPVVGAQTEEKSDGKTSLLIVDVQQFYFSDGFMPLENPEAASLNCKKLLQKFRGEDKMVVHVGHNTKKDVDFHPDVAPLDGERVFYKDEVSAFNGTDLLPYLQENGVERLVVCGMMTHMCVEAAVRAAHDLGFECVLVSDACATRDLKYGDETVSAGDVHNATLGTIDRTYATVVDTKTFLEKY
jgi:nicotinamidase-related amidase